MTPSVGRIVHYVSYGTPGGEFTSRCRAAVITECDPDNSVGLCVLNPTGLFFHSLADGGCAYDSGTTEDSATTGIGYAGGTWHWPERV